MINLIKFKTKTMSNIFIDRKLERDFEDSFGWENIIKKNEKIGRYLEFVPEVEYSVCNDTGCCYSPSNVGDFYPTPELQKAACDLFLKEQAEKYPNGWVIKDGYKTTKREHYPAFHRDWNYLVEALKRLSQKGIYIELNYNNIFDNWQQVCSACE